MVKERPLSEIAPDPHQPRKTFDLAPILATFDSGSASIWEPITIRLTKPGEKNPDGSARTEPFTIVEGEQRYQAAKLHGMATIPTLPPVDLDGDALLLRQIASGSTKKPLLPLEVADAVGPYGAKGVGEIGLVPTAAAVANALCKLDGVRRTTLPLKDLRLLGKKPKA